MPRTSNANALNALEAPLSRHHRCSITQLVTNPLLPRKCCNNVFEKKKIISIDLFRKKYKK